MSQLDVYLFRVSVILNFYFFMSMLYKSYMTYDEPMKSKIRRYVTYYLIFAEIGRLVWFVQYDVLTYDKLPLHLCSYSIFMIIFEEFRPTKFVKSFVVLCGAPCAIAALIVPLNGDSPLQIINLQSIITHMCIMLMGFIWVGDKYVPHKNDNRNNRVIFMVLISISTVINYFWNTNFMYINYPIFYVGMPLWMYRSLLVLAYLLMSDVMYILLFKRRASIEEISDSEIKLV